MKIKDNHNLTYDKIARVFFDPGDYEKVELEPRICILEKYEHQNGIIKLYFKNKSEAQIKAKNSEGEKDIDLIVSKLDEFIDKSYEEILEVDF